MDEYRKNPFLDQGIVNHEQFKLYPFLVFGTLNVLKNRIKQQIEQIKHNDYFGERLIIAGERGIGKTSSLFFIRDMLSESGIRVELLSSIFNDEDHLAILLKKKESRYGELIDNPKHSSINLFELTKEPIYFLIDFPDTLETKQYKNFLQSLWRLMTHQNSKKINLIFAINRSHYNKSFSYSETLGKFVLQSLDKFNEEFTRKLISTRLKTVNMKLKDVFTEEVVEDIFRYSKGIPRNIVSACGLLYDCYNGKPLASKISEKILKDKYFDKIIDDHVQDLELKRVYKKMIVILKEEYQGTANAQEDFLEKVMVSAKIGRNSAISRLNELSQIGIFKLYRGGYNRLNKIISFT